MKIAVVAYSLSEPGWNEDWKNLCIASSIEYKSFDSFDPDFIDDLLAYNPDRVLWRSGNIPYKKIKDEMQRQFLDKTELRVVPDWKTHYLYDHKIRQTYLFNLHGIPHPETKVFFNEAYALEYIEKAEYPFITKTDGGAGGKSFRFIETKEQALVRVREAFGGSGRITGREHEKHILYIQEYIPASSIWRVCMFKNKIAFGFIQKTREETKVASYRNEKVYPPVPTELLDMTQKINYGMNWDWMFYDLIWSKKYGRYLVLEVTDTCDAGSPAGRSLTYYRENNEWVAKQETPPPPEIIFKLFVLEDRELAERLTL
ncbi:hypothetical protein KA005_69305 [bacterium]|nr:hypothetical protein [bacterium]